MDRSSSIYVAGGDTLIGSALLRRLHERGFETLVGSGDEPDLTNAAEVESFFHRHRPQYIFLTAGKSGGIAANQRYPADLMLDNLLSTSHVVAAAHRHGAGKLLYLASSCCYPRLSAQPMQVEHLSTGRLEPTNEAYATAKIAGMTLCQAFRAQYQAPFICAIPANPFGPGDSLDVADTHVIVALLQKMHLAKTENRPAVEIWGTGAARREFLYVEDLAEACIFLMENYDSDAPINIPGNADVSIGELAQLIRDIVGYRGALEFNPTYPDGMPAKSLDGSAMKSLGWFPCTSLRDGIAATYQWIIRHGVPQQRAGRCPTTS